MKSAILFLCIVSTSISSLYPQLLARSTTVLGGSTKEISLLDKTLFVSQSIGQASVIGLHKHPRYIMLQGFQQPLLASYSSVSSKELVEPKVQISPNPFNNFTKVYLEKPLGNPISIQLVDIMGRKVFSQSFPSSSVLRLSLGNLSQGFYRIEIRFGTHSIYQSLIKETP